MSEFSWRPELWPMPVALPLARPGRSPGSVPDVDARALLAELRRLVCLIALASLVAASAALAQQAALPPQATESVPARTPPGFNAVTSIPMPRAPQRAPVVEQAKLIEFHAAEYPPGHLFKGVEAVVPVRLQISPEGTVTSVKADPPESAGSGSFKTIDRQLRDPPGASASIPTGMLIGFGCSPG